MIVARQIAKRYADKGIVAISLNPGAYMRPLLSLVVQFTYVRAAREHQN